MNQRARHAPLPARAGVAASYVWLPAGDWPDLQSFLQQRFPNIELAVWQARAERGELLEADGAPCRLEQAYRAGKQLFYYRELEQETPIPFQETILYQDQHIVAVDKPHFLPVTPSGRFLQETLLVRLKQRLQLPDLTPIHRLDRETAGVVLFSHRQDTRGAYQALFRERQVEKEYEALAPPLAEPHPPLPFIYHSRIVQGEPFFCMQQVAGEPNAETEIDLLAQHGALVLYRLRPKTGRTHQLRVHMAALGAPILNDGFYPHALPCKGDDFSRPLQLLARSLRFIDPINGELRELRSGRTLALA
jgi:tRNA pseudouridine32 synthase/23S rRNA pseudouridine746 synthase